MSITRINTFHAREGRSSSLRDFLTSILPLIEASHGCETCRLLQNQADPLEFIVLEVWTSVDAHRASTQNIPSEKISAVMPLLSAPPTGAYYD